MAIGAGISGQWFIVATPTGSNATTFHNVLTGSGWSSSFTTFNPSTPTPANWGTAGNYPTNSAFVPTTFVRNNPSPYPASFYDYTDPNTGGTVRTKPQNIQLVNATGIITGSNFSGRTITGSSDSPGIIGSFASGSIGFQAIAGALSPISFASVVSMSLSPNSFTRGFNFSTFLGTVDNNFTLIYRDFTNNAEAFYNVVNYNNQSIIDSSFYSWRVSHVSSTGTLVSGSNLGSGSITFINKNQHQKTFIVAGAANPNGSQRFAGQFSTGSVGASGDFRSGIIKFYVTESNTEADWDYLLTQLIGDNLGAGQPTTLASQHNLFMFTGSAGVSSSYYLITGDTA
jgi:hypothetical protein